MAERKLLDNNSQNTTENCHPTPFYASKVWWGVA
jgi:hypothetical protein